MTATHAWLDVRVPFDNAARQQSLELLDRVVAALREDLEASPQPVTVVDIGAGTGNSARWVQQHVRARLPEHELRWVLVDADDAALHTAASLLPGVQTITGEIAQLPGMVHQLLDATPSRLLVTGSAVLDVLTEADLAAIIDTLDRYNGLALFMLSITGKWKLNPNDDDDDVVDQAFKGHQQRHNKLGATAPEILGKLAQQAGASVATSVSEWQLKAPQDQAFVTRFLAERIDAAIEHQPELTSLASSWLHRRLGQAATGLTVNVEHLDMVVDARDTSPHKGQWHAMG